MCSWQQDIKRIAQSLSKVTKRPLPDLELRPGQQVDINILLSLVEDIIRQQNRAAGDFYTEDTKRDHTRILSLHAVNLQGNRYNNQNMWNTLQKNC